jgi:YfiH family protein
MAHLEFPLAQGWSKGLHIGFEDAETSQLLNLDRCFHVEQVHGKEIYQVSPSDLKRVGPLAKADGLFVQGDWFKVCPRPVVIKTADCVPLFLIDRQSESVCALHAGWRGLQQGIHRLPFERGWMDPKFTWAWMGPCLNGQNFEVGEDMWKSFPLDQQRNSNIFKTHLNPEKRYFETWEFVTMEFQKLGVDLVYNVEVDTFEDPSFASYRRARKSGQEKSETRNLSWAAFATRESITQLR